MVGLAGGQVELETPEGGAQRADLAEHIGSPRQIQQRRFPGRENLGPGGLTWCFHDCQAEVFEDDIELRHGVGQRCEFLQLVVENHGIQAQAALRQSLHRSG
jgi:hypothetical protein